MPIQPTVLHPENSPDVNLHPETDAGQVTDFLNKTYPVNSIFMSVDSTSPASLFGGTWTQIKNGFLLSAGYDNIPAGSTGGAKEKYLVLNNMPENAIRSVYANKDSSAINVRTVTSNATGLTVYSNVQDVSEFRYDLTYTNTPVSIMPPYIAVYMWKRVA